jgi:hypothetical protein
MTKKSRLRIMRDKMPSLTNEQIKAAEREFYAHPQDNSPQVDSKMLADVVEQVSALNLGNLSHELSALTGELPLLIEIESHHDGSFYPTGELMAIAFESGRRYMLLAVFQILSEEIETLPTERVESAPGPVLEM